MNTTAHRPNCPSCVGFAAPDSEDPPSSLRGAVGNRFALLRECVANVDLLPTLASLHKIKTAGREQGRDATAFLNGDNSHWKSHAFIEKDNFSQSGVFTKEWELGLNHEGGSVLFDRREDPWQIHNLYGDPAHLAKRKELIDLTKKHANQVDSPARSWVDLL